MGGSSSKGGSNRIEPELPKSESWSTLDGFVAAEAGRSSPEAIAVNTTVNDEEIKQVKTWMNFPDRKPKSTLNLDLHLSQLKSKKSQVSITDQSPDSASGASGLFLQELGETPAEPVPKPRQLMLKHTISRTSVTCHDPEKTSKMSFDTSGHSNDSAHRIARQATRMYMERQMSKRGHEMVKHTPSTLTIGQAPAKLERQITKGAFPITEKKLDVQVDALNNMTHKPTDQQIRRQIQRWKTEFSLSKHDQPVADNPIHGQPVKPPKPKQTKSFYDLRKAMVNREDVSLEHSSIIIKPMPVVEQTVKKESSQAIAKSIVKHGPESTADIPAKSKPAQEERKTSNTLLNKEEIKIYSKDPNFEYKISRDAPPGFEITVDPTELENRCKELVHNIQAEKGGNSVRKEVEGILQLWKQNGFLKSIEEYVLSVAPGSNYSISEVAHHIFCADASYLVSLTGNDMHMQLAKAFATYCWVGNNMSINIASMLAGDEEQCGFLPDNLDIENRSASFDHCTLFVKLAVHADLEAAIINGQVRTWKKLNEDLNFPSPHSWNVVKICDIPLPLDCFFGSGCVNDSFLGIKKAFTPDYFGMPPQQIILTHLPQDPSHQLLENPLSIDELQPIIPLPMTTLGQGIYPLSWCENIILSSELQYPIVSVDVKTSNTNIILSANLTPEPEIDMHEEGLDQNIQIKRVNNFWNIKVAIPLKGRYSLNVFSKTCEAVPDTLCLSYIIHSEVCSELKLGYPKLHGAALTTCELNLLHWNSPQSYMCQNLSGILNLVFEAKSNVKFDHFVLPGRVATPNSFIASNAKRYNTMLLSNIGSDTSLHQLQAVFPSNGWWTLELLGMLPTSSSQKYISLLTYYIYVTVGLPRHSYPHIFSSDIVFNSTRPMSATGEELFTIQFASSKFLDFHHYLTFDQVTNDVQEGFTNIEFDGKVRGKDLYIYNLKVIFSQAGVWYIHVLGKEDKSPDIPYSNLFKVNADVKGAMANTSFITYNKAIGESFGINIGSDGLLTFPDNGEPLCYSFEALPQINFFHDIKRHANDMSTYDFCTNLVSEPVLAGTCSIDNTLEKTGFIYTMRTVFPESGKWLVQLFGAKEGSINYSLVFTLNINVSTPSPQLCYPKFNPSFCRLKMSIDAEDALIQRTCEDGEFLLPFKAPDNVLFTWTMELVSAGEKNNSNAFLHHKEDGTRCFQVIFPKPGEWLIRLFAKQTTDLSANFHSVLEVNLNSLSCKSGLSFPHIFEAFYSVFNLKLDANHLPLVSEVKQLPTKIFIPLTSMDTDVLFWHDVDVKDTGNEDGREMLNLDDQCKMTSDPTTGQHKLIVEVNAKGKWTVLLYARRAAAADKSWTVVLKFVVTAV